MKIGIIGGGQLGLMMAEAARKLDFDVIGLDPNIECPLSFVAPIIVGDYTDKTAFKKLADSCDVLTYEFENVDLDLVHEYAHMIPQKAMALEISKHRIIEKTFAASCDLPIPTFHTFKDKKDITLPCVIKTTTDGYDGKGQYVIKTVKQLEDFTPIKGIEYIVEALIPFDYEVSCIVSRDVFGYTEVQPIPINTHKQGILFLSDVTTDVPKDIIDMITKYTKKLVDALDYIGTLAVEYFVIKDKVIFNEFAPRPHNSGHFSIEGSSVSQFKNHILAICGLPVEKTCLKQPSIMLNLLGHSISVMDRFKFIDNIYFHDYHKSCIKPGRKMGHVTISDSNIIALKKSLLQILEAIK